MTKELNLTFCFKGSRKYVQGPDIFDAVVAQLEEEFHAIKGIKYTAYNMLHKNATMYITNKVVKAEYPIINSLISFMHNGVKYYVVVCENDNEIECATEYSEEIVNKQSTIIDKTITFLNILDDSYVEIVVSMNKYFLNQTIKEKGKWIVTKFDFFELNDIKDIKNKEIRVELVQNLNNKLTKSLLYLDDSVVGHLYFSLIPKES